MSSVKYLIVGNFALSVFLPYQCLQTDEKVSFIPPRSFVFQTFSSVEKLTLHSFWSSIVSLPEKRYRSYANRFH